MRLTLTHGLTNANLATSYDSNYAYLRIIVSELFDSGSETVRYSNYYFIDNLISDGSTLNTIEYYFDNSDVAN